MSEDYQISIVDYHGRFQCFGHNIGQRMFLQHGLHPAHANFPFYHLDKQATGMLAQKGKVHISSYGRELKSLNVIDRV
jgi:hypothetical protein